MTVESKSLKATPDAPTLRQRLIGLLAVLLTLSFISVISTMGEGLHDLTSTLKAPPTMAMTLVLIETGKFLSSFWYVVVVLFIGSYFFWVSKKTARMLWFNAVVSVALPLTIWTTTYVCIQQHVLILEMLRKK